MNNKPTLCVTCGEYKAIVKSITTIAGPGKEFWYCRTCKVEIDSMGYPPGKGHDEEREWINEWLAEGGSLGGLGID